MIMHGFKLADRDAPSNSKSSMIEIIIGKLYRSIDDFLGEIKLK